MTLGTVWLFVIMLLSLWPSSQASCLRSCPRDVGSCSNDSYGVCQCDEMCGIYGDCCSTALCHVQAGGNTANYMQCRSIHLDTQAKPGPFQSFWMVSECPANWLVGKFDRLLLDIRNKCSYSENLPPVTDTSSGVVYKNEYCAVCHGVENVEMWTYSFQCTNWLYNMIQSQTNFQLTTEIIQRECIACQFYPPTHIVHTARPCLHDSLVKSTCLEREELQWFMRVTITEERYQDIVDQCHNGPIDPVKQDTEGSNNSENTTTYKNQHCAMCNGIDVVNDNLVCHNPFNDVVIDYCSEKVHNLSPERPIFSISTHPTSTLPPFSPTSTLTPTPSPSVSEPGSTSYLIPDDYSGSGYIQDDISGSGYPVIGIYLEDSYEITLEDSGPSPSFTFFLDINGNTETVQYDDRSYPISVTCSMEQVFDWFDNVCRTTVCQGKSCTLINNTENNSSLCFIPQNSEFELLPGNDTLLFNDKVYDIVDYYNGSLPIICLPISDDFENCTEDNCTFTYYVNVTVISYSYPKAFVIITYVGCSMSVIGCVFVLLTYFLFKELRTLPGKILMNLSATIIATCVLVMVAPIIQLSNKDELCDSIAIFLHWLALSQFTWMTIMSCDLARTLLRATRMRLAEPKRVQNHILIVYMVLGWCLPAAFVGLSVIINYTTNYIRYGEDNFCWIRHATSFYVVFLAPVALAVLLTGLAFAVTAYLLFQAVRGKKKLEKKNNSVYYYFRIYLSVFSITSLTWVFGFNAILARDEWAWYLFIILTSTQGFTICAAFIFTRRIVLLYKQLICGSIYGSFRSTFGARTKETTLNNNQSESEVNTVKVLESEDSKKLDATEGSPSICYQDNNN